MAFALASAASASALKKGFSGEGTIIAISFFCCATAGIAPAVSSSVGIASNLTMDFQFRGRFVGIVGLDLGWGEFSNVRVNFVLVLVLVLESGRAECWSGGVVEYGFCCLRLFFALFAPFRGYFRIRFFMRV